MYVFCDRVSILSGREHRSAVLLAVRMDEYRMDPSALMHRARTGSLQSLRFSFEHPCRALTLPSFLQSRIRLTVPTSTRHSALARTSASSTMSSLPLETSCCQRGVKNGSFSSLQLSDWGPTRLFSGIIRQKKQVRLAPFKKSVYFCAAILQQTNHSFKTL